MSSDPDPQQPAFPAPPALLPFARIAVEVDAVVSLGPAPGGERRYVPLTGGTVEGPGLAGRVRSGGVDWQLARDDGVLEIAAHYVIETPDGALVEVQSTGMRHGPPEVMARLAAGEDVPPDLYWFRTVVRMATGSPRWAHLNRSLAIASGRREARRVMLDLWLVG